MTHDLTSASSKMRIKPRDHKVAYSTTSTAGTKKERLVDLASDSGLLDEPRLCLPGPQTDSWTRRYFILLGGDISPPSPRHLLEYGVDLSFRNKNVCTFSHFVR